VVVVCLPASGSLFVFIWPSTVASPQCQRPVYQSALIELVSTSPTARRRCGISLGRQWQYPTVSGSAIVIGCCHPALGSLYVAGSLFAGSPEAIAPPSGCQVAVLADGARHAPLLYYGPGLCCRRQYCRPLSFLSAIATRTTSNSGGAWHSTL